MPTLIGIDSFVPFFGSVFKIPNNNFPGCQIRCHLYKDVFVKKMDVGLNIPKQIIVVRNEFYKLYKNKKGILKKSDLLFILYMFNAFMLSVNVIYKTENHICILINLSFNSLITPGLSK